MSKRGGWNGNEASRDERRAPTTEERDRHYLEKYGSALKQLGDESTPCSWCYSTGLVWTGIDESPFYVCERCDGTGLTTLPAPCPNPEHMGEFACANKTQCWEPCGELGKNGKFAACTSDVNTDSNSPNVKVCSEC